MLLVLSLNRTNLEYIYFEFLGFIPDILNSHFSDFSWPLME